MFAPPTAIYTHGPGLSPDIDFFITEISAYHH